MAGDNFLGGEDFTAVLEKMFYDAHPQLNRFTLSERRRQHIRRQAECARLVSEKPDLGDEMQYRGKEYVFPIELPDYEEACEELLDRIRQPVKRSLKDAHIRLSDIDQVVWLGRCYQISGDPQICRKAVSMIPDTKINPDEAVALGAAIQAAMKERRDGIREVILTDVCPFTLGTEVVQEYGDHQYEDGVFFPIIERNTVIPASRTERLYTVRDNQTRIRVHILQGESRFAVNNLSLGELFIEVLPESRQEA